MRVQRDPRFNVVERRHGCAGDLVRGLALPAGP